MRCRKWRESRIGYPLAGGSIRSTSASEHSANLHSAKLDHPHSVPVYPFAPAKTYALNAKMNALADRAGDLEIFTVVVDAGSFSAAGRRLGLAPSSIGRVIDRIEARLRLGARLLLRTTRSLTLTAEGAAYLSAGRRIIADLRETEQAISDQGSPRGRLRVSTSILYGRMFLVPVLGAFTRRYPDILLDINLTDAVVDIAAGQADVGVRLARSPMVRLPPASSARHER